MKRHVQNEPVVRQVERAIAAITKKLRLDDDTRIVVITAVGSRLIALDAAGRLWRRFIESPGWDRMDTPREAQQRMEAQERREAANANRRAARAKHKKARR